MAIDPNISLGFQQPKTPDLSQYMNMALTGQQLQNAQTQNQLGQAQLPGVQAESDIKQRAADFNKWITDNKSNYTNEDGTPNIEKFVNGASSAGYFKEAQATASTDLANKAAVIKNSTDAQSKNIATMNYTQSQIGHVANLLTNAPPEQRQALLQQYANYSNTQVPGSGQQLQLTLGGVDPKTGAPMVDPSKLKAATDATMTPLEAGNLAVANANVRISAQNAVTAATGVYQSGLQSMTGPDSTDPASGTSQAAVKFATEHNIPGVTQGMNAYQISHLPGFAEAYAAQIIPAATKAAAVQDSTLNLQKANQYGTAAATVDKLVQSGVIPPGVKAITWMEAHKANYSNNKDYLNALSTMHEITTNNPSINLDTDPAIASSQLKTQQGLALKNSRTSAAVANSTTFHQAQPAAEAQAAQPNPGQPAAGGKKAPPAAEALLKQHPNLAPAFKQKYGYLQGQ